MLATETKRIFKDGAVIFIVLAAIVAGILFTDRDAYLAPALEIFLLLYASFTGWSLFERERQENAGEYMLSLPLSRSRLLLLKFLPRLLSVSLMLLIYLRLHQSWHLPSFLNPFDFSVLFAGFFLLSIAFSISFKNFITAFFTTCLLLIGQILLIKLLDNFLFQRYDATREIGLSILQASLTVLIFPLFFFFLFQRYDIKPISYFNKKFFPGLLILTLLIAGIIILTAPRDWNNLYLTPNGLILKNSCQRSEILVDHQRHHFKGCLTVLRETEDGNTLYCLINELKQKEKCINKNLAVIDLKTGALKTIYRFPEGWAIYGGYPGEIGAIQNGTYSLLLQNTLLKKAMLLQVHNGNIRKIPIAGNFYDPNIGYVFYLNSTPPQFIILSDPNVYRLDISGRTEELTKTKSFNVWQDKMLLFESSGINLYQVGEKLTLLLQRKGNYKKNLRHISGFESRSVIYHVNRDYFWLDMEQQKESKLDLLSPPYTYQQSGDDFNVVFAHGSTFTIMKIRSGKRSETVWELGFQPSGIRISPFGLLVFREQKYKVYPFNN
jgi:hypothetical protein